MVATIEPWVVFILFGVILLFILLLPKETFGAISAILNHMTSTDFIGANVTTLDPEMVRAEKVRVLQVVLQHLRSGKQKYVCFAITSIMGATVESSVRYRYVQAACGELVEYVHSALGDHTSLDSWIAETHPEFRQEMVNATRTEYVTKMETTRIAWVEWMIEQLQNEDNSIRG